MSVTARADGLGDLDPLPADDLRAVFAQVAAPVAVAATIGPAGPHGTTVSAFGSLSLDPPLVSVSLDRSSDLLAAIRAHGAFSINVLARGQEALAMNFARKGCDKFRGVSVGSLHGLPHLTGCQSCLAAKASSFVDAGDHVIAIGLVVASRSEPREPLVYHRRGFHRLVPEPGTSR